MAGSAGKGAEFLNLQIKDMHKDSQHPFFQEVLRCMHRLTMTFTMRFSRKTHLNMSKSILNYLCSKQVKTPEDILENNSDMQLMILLYKNMKTSVGIFIWHIKVLIQYQKFSYISVWLPCPIQDSNYERKGAVSQNGLHLLYFCNKILQVHIET